MFTRQLLRSGASVALRRAEGVAARVRELAATGEAFDLQQLFFSFTLDTFGEIAFGVAMDSRTDPAASGFAKAFDYVQHTCNGRLANPLWRVWRVLGLGAERECARQITLMKRFGRRIIGAKRRQAEDGATLGPDLVSRFLDSARKQGAAVSDDELLDLVLNFMIAGRDTTASALSWTVFELLQQPGGAALRDVDNELARVLPPAAVEAAAAATTREAAERGASEPAEHGVADLYFEACYNRLPVLKAACSEALRLHPSVMKDGKFCVTDDTLLDGTAVKRGMAVIYCPYALGRDPELWEQPEEFRPARWLEQDASEGAGEGKAPTGSLYRPTAVSDYVLPVFNAGPRVCLGRPLAYLEVQLLLAVLLPQFEFELARDREHNTQYVNSLVSPRKHGLWVTAKCK